MQIGNMDFYAVTVISDLQLRVIRFTWRELEARVAELDGSHLEDVSYNLMVIANELSKPEFSAIAGALAGDEKPPEGTKKKFDFDALLKTAPLLIKMANKHILPILARSLKVKRVDQKDWKKLTAEDLQRYPQAFYVFCVVAGLIANYEQYQDLWNTLVVDFLKKNASGTVKKAVEKVMTEPVAEAQG